VRNIIGYGLPTRAGTAKAHGEPPGDAELDGAKDKLGWPKQPRFYLPEEALNFFRQAVERGAELEQAWQEKFAAYRAAYPELAAELERRLAGILPDGWHDGLPEFPADEKGMATRASSGKVLNALAVKVPELFGGSADLAPSTNTWITTSPAFAPSENGTDCHEGVTSILACANTVWVRLSTDCHIMVELSHLALHSWFSQTICAHLYGFRRSRIWVRSGFIPTTALEWVRMALPISRLNSLPRCAPFPIW